jgi:hypothetical protein
MASHGRLSAGTRLSLRGRLERLEADRLKHKTAETRMTIVVMGAFDGERHIEIRNGTFHEEPGPGLQIQDFGKFDPVIYMTEEESEM